MPTKKDDSPTSDGAEGNSTTEAKNEDSDAGADVKMESTNSDMSNADQEAEPSSESPEGGSADGKTNGKSGLTAPPPTQIKKFKLSGGPAANVIKKERRQSSSRFV